jgi:hypothetical protein
MAINFPSSPTDGQVFADSNTNLAWVYSSASTAWSASFNRSNYVSQTFTATAGQTSFTVSGGYLPTLVEVYQNGVLLVNGTDVTVTSGTAVVLAVGAVVGDIIQVIGSTTFNYAATVPVSKGGTGASTLAANSVLLGNNGSALQTVAPGTNGNVLTSNGTTWTSAAAAGTLTGQTIIWGGASTPSGYLKCDGTVYTKSSYSALSTAIGLLPVSITAYSVSGVNGALSYANGNVIYSYNQGLKYSSNQGSSYTTITDANLDYPTDVVWNGTYYVVGLNDGCGTPGFAYSTNLSTWTRVNGGTADYNNIAASGSTVILLRSNGGSYYTTNGTSWTVGGSWGSANLGSSIISNNAGTFVAVGRTVASTAPGIATSTNNGVTWTARTVPSNIPTSAAVAHVTWQNNLFIVCDTLGNVGSSPDGITWTAKGKISNVSSVASRIIYLSATGLYYANQWYSADLITWYLLPQSPGLSYAVYVANDMVTDGTYIYRSDGSAKSWKPYNYNTSTQFVVPNYGADGAGPVPVAGATYYIKT